MAYIFLSDLSTKQQTWSVKVKVMRLWESINKKTEELMSLDMILMDGKVNWAYVALYYNINFIYFNGY
jgi:hypothetical protein